MSLQEPVLRAANVGFSWDLSPRFPDVRGAITDVLRAATGSVSEWSWESAPDGPLVLVWHEENRLHAFASPEGLDLVSEQPDTEGLLQSAHASLSECLGVLHLSGVTQTRAGGMWMLPAASSLDAEAALEGWLFSPRLRSLMNPFGGRPNDLIAKVRFETDSGLVTYLTAEPVTDDQAAKGPFFAGLVDASEFPPGAVLVDVDRIDSAEEKGDDAVARATKHLDQVFAHTAKFLATVNVNEVASTEPEGT